jgi:hypothetical protein
LTLARVGCQGSGHARVAVFQRGRKVTELVGDEISEASLSVAMNAGFVTAAGSDGAAPHQGDSAGE